MNIIKYFLIGNLLLIGLSSSVNGQTILRNENFDHLTAGISIGIQDTTGYWSVFADTIGSIHDPLVSDELFISTPNSLYLYESGGIYDLGKRTKGKYELTFNVYIKEYSWGLFSLIQEKTEDTYKSGFELTFDNSYQDQQVGHILANNKTIYFDYNQEEWISIRIIIDIDDDFGTIYLNNYEISFFRWYGGSTGLTGVSTIESLMFFADYFDGSNGDFFVDNIVFAELNEIISAPTNLNAKLTSNNVELNWSAPSDYDATSYIIFKNGNIIDTIYDKTTYIDTNLYPSLYTYSIRANTSEKGYSKMSDSVSVNIEGGIERKNTLFEIFTGTWCVYCPGAALAADDLIDNGDKAAIIEYHNGDIHQVDHGLWRNEKFYTVNLYPTAFVDGGQELAWGNPTETIYPIYKPMHDKGISKPSLHNITLDVVKNSNNIYTVKVTVEEVFKYFNNLKLQVALTESHIEEEWQGLSELNFVLLEMFPNARGTTLDFSSNNTIIKTFTIELDETSIAANCEIVVFVQDDETQEVSQTVKLNLTDPSVGINRYFNSSINLYPNPTSDFVQISSGSKEIKSIEVFNMNGSKVGTYENAQYNQGIYIGNFVNGLYLFKLHFADGNIEFHKIIKN